MARHRGFFPDILTIRVDVRPTEGIVRNMQLLRELEATRDETLRYFSLDQGDLTRTYAGKWSVRFILHHLSDSETVLFDRIRRVLSEPRQVL